MSRQRGSTITFRGAAAREAFEALTRKTSPRQRRFRQMAGNPLTPSQQETLDYLVLGYTNPEIAKIRGLPLGTIRGHVDHIKAKLETSSRVETAVEAIRLGLVDIGLNDKETT